MEAFGLYLLKSAIWLTGFTIVFLVFLRNERYFQLNRAYLLSGIFASIAFPFYTWHYAVILPSLPTPDISIPDISERVMVATAPTAEPGMPVYWWLYLVGIAFLAFKLIWQTIMVIRKLLKTGYVKNGPVKLVRTPEFSASFSFFSFVFVNPSTSDIEMKEIVNHECGHIQKRHWFDLLLVELLRMLQWFNPFAWIYAHLVRQNHEYMADEIALKRTSNPAIYQATLLNQMLGVPVISLANSFSYSLNKKRFKMMKKKIDSPFRKLKMLIVLPLITFVFYAFAKPEYIAPSSAVQSGNISHTTDYMDVNSKVIEQIKESPLPLTTKTLRYDKKMKDSKLKTLDVQKQMEMPGDWETDSIVNKMTKQFGNSSGFKKQLEKEMAEKFGSSSDFKKQLEMEMAEQFGNSSDFKKQLEKEMAEQFGSSSDFKKQLEKEMAEQFGNSSDFKKQLEKEMAEKFGSSSDFKKQLEKEVNEQFGSSSDFKKQLEKEMAEKFGSSSDFKKQLEKEMAEKFGNSSDFKKQLEKEMIEKFGSFSDFKKQLEGDAK